MALQKRILPIRFGQGVDTKVDPKQQIMSTFRRAVNVTYETVFSVKKRNGYDRLPLITYDNAVIDGAEKVTTFKNELDVFANNHLYSFSTSTEKLSDKGTLYVADISTSPVINSAYSHTNSDVAAVGNLEGYCYANTNSEIRYAIKDNVDDGFLAANNLVGTGTEAKIVAINGYFYIFYANSATISYRRVLANNPENLEAAVPIANNLNSTDRIFDVISANNKMYVVYNSSVASGYIRVAVVNADGSIGSGLGIAGTSPAKAICAFVDSSTNLNIFYASATALNYIKINSDVTAFLVIETSIDATANCVNIGVLEQTSTNIKAWYEISAASGLNHYIKQVEITPLGAIAVAPAVFARGLGLQSKPFKLQTYSYIPTVFAPDVQSTTFILDVNAKLVAKFAVGVSSGLYTIGALPHTIIMGNSALLTSRYAVRTEAENDTFFSVLGVAAVTVNFSPTNPIQTATLGDNLHIAAGVLWAYDGDEVVEHGFNMYPNTVEAGSTGTSSGSMSNGNYGYLAVYKWSDNYGQEHRSAASASLDISLSGGGSTQFQNVVVPSLRLTNKTQVSIELYRTEASGSIYYRTATAINDPTVDTVTVLDTRSDSALIVELPLYTTGDVLDNAPAPVVNIVGVHTSSNRLFAVGEDRNLLVYSKIRQSGYPVEWNEALVKPVDPIGGSITAVTSMDEKLIIFKEDAVLFLSGSGPNNLGQQDSFTEPERVAIDVGCIDPDSIVLIPAGLMFKSRKGIYLLNRALAISYIGNQVEAFNASTITSAKILTQNNQVRFTTADNECLVYNYYLGLWSTFDNHQALSAEVVNNTYYYVRNSRELFRENQTSFSDNGSPVPILLETGWMSFADLQGFQRVYKMLLLGDWKSEHLLRVRAAYDFKNAWTHEKVLDPTPDIVSGVAYGDASPYGSESPYGGDGNVYQARFDFAKQKCQSIKLQFQDLQSVPGEGLSLSAVTLELGGKNGLFKPGQAKIKGIS